MVLPHLENILFIDIETVPEAASFDAIDADMQQLFTEKTAYQRKDDTTPEEFYNKAGIWAEFGKIICISVGYFASISNNRQFRTTSFYGEEKKILQDFSNLLSTKFHQKDIVLCGHNIKEFDLPYICRRMIIHQVAIPSLINAMGKKPWEVKHLDTMEMWRFGDHKHFTSLKLLCKILQIPTPKDDIDGSQVAHVYYTEKDIDRIIIYCEKDVVAVAQIILRLKHLPLLEPTEHLSV